MTLPAESRMNRMFLQFESIGRWATIGLGLTIPISVAADNFLLAVILAMWLASACYRDKLAIFRSNHVAMATTAMFVLILIGSLYGLGQPMDKLGALGKYVDLAFVPLFMFFFSRHGARLLGLQAFGVAMTLTLVLSFLIWLGPTSVAVLFNHPPDNPTVFKLHITHGIFMAFAAFLFVVGSQYVGSVGARIGLLLAAALAAFNVLFMVQGRTGYLALGILATLLLVTQFRWRGLALAIVAASLVSAGGYELSAPFRTRVDLIVSEMAGWESKQGNSTSVGLRMDYYTNAISIIRDHPLVGVGIGGFESAYAEKITGTSMAPSNNPHNQYLLITAQLGIFGLVLLLAMFVVQWWRGTLLPQPWNILAKGLVLTFVAGNLFNSLLIDHAERLLFAWLVGLVFSVDIKCRTADTHGVEVATAV
jgi:O-antigen ligase